MTQEKNKKDGYASWRRFRNRVNLGLLIFALITLYCSFYFVGPIRGKVIDAKTDEPIANIGVRYSITGNDHSCFNPGGCSGWDNDRKGYTDNNGVFKIPLSIAMRIPFIQTIDSKRKILVNGVNSKENENYDRYEQEFTWQPFKNFIFSLVPIPKTLDDCRDNLTEKEQYRCVQPLAIKDAGSLSYDYLIAKYQNILNSKCDLELYADDPNCIAFKAFNQKDRNICANDKSCLFEVAIDLQDKSWCELLPSKVSIESREYCEKVIDACQGNLEMS